MKPEAKNKFCMHQLQLWPLKLGIAGPLKAAFPAEKTTKTTRRHLKTAGG